MLRETSPDNLNLCLHRAFCWLQHAEMAEDTDGRFLFLWTVFIVTRYAIFLQGFWGSTARKSLPFKPF